MGLKRNISYNIILTLSQYLIGFITFPYISRVLGASNIGIVSFVDNTINYFVLFSTLGAATIGTREISKHRNEKTKLSNVFSSLIIIYSIYTFIVLACYLLAVSFIDRLKIHQELFYIGTAKLVFSVFLIEWFYRGLENFKYITSRTLIIKIIYVILIFIFIRTSQDYKMYFILTTFTVVINAIINIVYSKNFVKLSFKNIKLKPYFKQSFYLGSYSVLTSMYTTFNVMYLGFVSDTKQVGYYWAAITLFGILLGFFSAFTSATMPRMSSLLSHGETEEFNKIITKSFSFLFTSCFPIIFGSIILAPQIIVVLSGNGFSGAIIPMQIIMPLILVVGIAQVLAIQILVPMQKDKIILFSSLIGATVGVLLNILLVKRFGSVGTALVLLSSESMVTFIYILSIWKYRIIKLPWKSLIKNFILALPVILICFFFINIFKDENILILITSLFSSILYFLILHIYILKNKDVKEIMQSMKSLLK